VEPGLRAVPHAGRGLLDIAPEEEEEEEEAEEEEEEEDVLQHICRPLSHE